MDLRTVVKVVWLFVLASLILVVGVYVYEFHTHPIGQPEHFAQFGDYVGGLLNPLIGISTIFLLVYSINVQIEELKLTREELSSQLTEQRENNKISLEIARCNERSLRLPSISRLIDKEFDRLEKLYSTEFSYSFFNLDDESSMSIFSLDANSPDKKVKSFKKIHAYLVSDSNKTKLHIDITCFAFFLDTLKTFKHSRELLEEYIANGGSTFVAKNLAVQSCDVCRIFLDCESTTLLELAEEISGLLYDFISGHYSQKESLVANDTPSKR